MRKRSEWGTRSHHQIIFRKGLKIFKKAWTRYIENVDQKMNLLYGSDDIEIRLPFYRPFSKFWNIFGGLCSQVRNDSKSFDCVVNPSHTTTTQI